MFNVGYATNGPDIYCGASSKEEDRKAIDNKYLVDGWILCDE